MLELHSVVQEVHESAIADLYLLGPLLLDILVAFAHRFHIQKPQALVVHLGAVFSSKSL